MPPTSILAADYDNAMSIDCAEVISLEKPGTPQRHSEVTDRHGLACDAAREPIRAARPRISAIFKPDHALPIPPRRPGIALVVTGVVLATAS